MIKESFIKGYNYSRLVNIIIKMKNLFVFIRRIMSDRYLSLRRIMMATIKLGRLEEVDVRKLWTHEQYDFSN